MNFIIQYFLIDLFFIIEDTGIATILDKVFRA